MADLEHVFGLVDRLPDVAHADRRAVAVGEHQVVVVGGFDQLVVGIDRETAALAVDRALGAVGGGDEQGGARVFQGEAHGREAGRVDLHAHGALALAADEHLADAFDGGDLLRQDVVGPVIGFDDRQFLGLHGEDEDRAVRRVDLPERRRRRQVARQLAGGRCHLGLHVEGGGVDVAVEVELDGDGGGAEHRGRCHLRDARDLRELPLQRLRHGGGHGFGACAGEPGVDVDGREFDARQRRDRQQGEGGQAHEHDRRHQQRSADRAANERCGDAHGRVSRCVRKRGAGRRLNWPAWLGSARRGRRSAGGIGH